MAFNVATILAVIGWIMAVVGWLGWMVECEERKSWQKQAEHKAGVVRHNGRRWDEMHNRMQSAEADLDKLLLLARKIRVKRAKRDK